MKIGLHWSFLAEVEDTIDRRAVRARLMPTNLVALLGLMRSGLGQKKKLKGCTFVSKYAFSHHIIVLC
jgi:hypothetical protein